MLEYTNAGQTAAAHCNNPIVPTEIFFADENRPSQPSAKTGQSDLKKPQSTTRLPLATLSSRSQISASAKSNRRKPVHQPAKAVPTCFTQPPNNSKQLIDAEGGALMSQSQRKRVYSEYKIQQQIQRKNEKRTSRINALVEWCVERKALQKKRAELGTYNLKRFKGNENISIEERRILSERLDHLGSYICTYMKRLQISQEDLDELVNNTIGALTMYINKIIYVIPTCIRFTSTEGIEMLRTLQTGKEDSQTL